MKESQSVCARALACNAQSRALVAPGINLASNPGEIRNAMGNLPSGTLARAGHPRRKVGLGSFVFRGR